MTLLFRILRAAHASGTHHKLALDALLHLKGPDSERWRRLFLEHAALYMQGSKAPDTEFKDFRNHVLHVRDGYWGGAPDKVASWYANLVDALKGARWSEAVWAAGVLSHYYTDPIHPFHTGQTEAENDIHRAVEWSISKSYDQLMRLASTEFASTTATPGDGADWLKAFVMDGAETSNRQYEKLIAHYDIDKGVTDPPSGLDPIGRKVVAELLRYAATGFAAVLDRAFAEAAVNPPDVNLALNTVIATLQIPIKQLAKRMADAEDRRIVERMFDELKTTGRVDQTLPEDDRIVRDLFAKEVLAPRAAEQAEQRAKALSAVAFAATSKPARRSGQSVPLPPAPAAATTSPAATSPARAPAETASKSTRESVVRPLSSGGSLASLLRIFLTADDDVERAPSIGPKTAGRLYEIGIRTVADLLAADPAVIAGEVRVRHITEQMVAEWQDQCRLVMSIPGLRGTHAQLLVGAGFRDVKALAAAEATDLSVAVLTFAATNEGQRVLREGHPPDVEKIAHWISLAQSQAA